MGDNTTLSDLWSRYATYSKIYWSAVSNKTGFKGTNCTKRLHWYRSIKKDTGLSHVKYCTGCT